MRGMFQLQHVIETRFPAFGSRRGVLAGPTLALLKKVVLEDEVNAFLADAKGLEGLAFIDRILEVVNFSYSVVPRELENIPVEGRVVIVANHPLGLLDGVALLQLVSKVRRDVRIVANDILMQFEPLHSLLLPIVNLGGGNNRSNVQAIHDTLDQDQAVIIFPSGEVSRAGPWGIRDVQWQSGFLRFAEQAGAPLLPVHLSARNSALFYSVSSIFKHLSTLMLVREAMRQRDTTMRVRVGQSIPWREIAALEMPRAQKIRRISGQLYGLPKNKAVLLETARPIAHPEDRLDVRRELRSAQTLGRTPDGKDIFVVQGRSHSAVLRELGRLREIAFRQVGEGTGQRRDLDAFDADYEHLVLWDDSHLQIAGAYRIGQAAPILEARGAAGLYSHGLFEFDPAFTPLLAQAVELGRSFVQPRYQGLRALEQLWCGIGAYLKAHPKVRYLFGPVSISATLPAEARRLLVHFYNRHYGAERRLATPRRPFVIDAADQPALAAVLPGTDVSADFRALKRRLAELGVGVPTLYKQYTELCEPGGAQFLGFGVDPAFGGCIDGLVLVDLQRLEPRKRQRYLGQTSPSSIGVIPATAAVWT